MHDENRISSHLGHDGLHVFYRVTATPQIYTEVATTEAPWRSAWVPRTAWAPAGVALSTTSASATPPPEASPPPPT